MPDKGLKRKLVAILSADVEGYSRLMRTHVLPLLVIAYLRMKRTAEAKSFASELISLDPNFSAELYTEALFYEDPKFRNRMIYDLISAGLT